VTTDTIDSQTWFTSAVTNFTHQAGAAGAHMQAIATLRNLVRRDAYVMAYSDCFTIIGVIVAIGCVAIFFAPKPKGAGGNGAA
jgi:DHA2 family multidrug resistance protein